MAPNSKPPPGSSQIFAGVGLDVAASHAKARSLLEEGRLDEAAELFGRIIAVNALDADAWCNLGTIWESRCRWQEAEAAYRRALAIAPNMPHAHCNLGSVLNSQRRFAEAEQACRAAISLRPNLVEWSVVGG